MVAIFRNCLRVPQETYADNLRNWRRYDDSSQSLASFYPLQLSE